MGRLRRDGVNGTPWFGGLEDEAEKSLDAGSNDCFGSGKANGSKWSCNGI